MHHRLAGLMGRGLLAVALAMALAACSTMNFSTFGGSQAEITPVADLGNYTADQALTEARAHFRNQDFGYSAALYKKFVELEPKNPEGYVGLGASYDRLGRFDLSDRVYASLYALTGGSTQYYNNLGYSYLLRGNLVGAATNFQKARSLDPANQVVAGNLTILANAAGVPRA
ncbi:MAG TPA: tetratricopeptide repeat protein [Devosia sp.]|nr:tetratricopeptide repeat protein [Devosia sp.]